MLSEIVGRGKAIGKKLDIPGHSWTFLDIGASAKPQAARLAVWAVSSRDGYSLVKEHRGERQNGLSI
jgi:hypothetical protein